ncbi:hypothetical protein ACWEOO_29980 [Kribbella sp. NPDC004138]
MANFWSGPLLLSTPQAVHMRSELSLAAIRTEARDHALEVCEPLCHEASVALPRSDLRLAEEGTSECLQLRLAGSGAARPGTGPRPPLGTWLRWTAIDNIVHSSPNQQLLQA